MSRKALCLYSRKRLIYLNPSITTQVSPALEIEDRIRPFSLILLCPNRSEEWLLIGRGAERGVTCPDCRAQQSREEPAWATHLTIMLRRDHSWYANTYLKGTRRVKVLKNEFPCFPSDSLMDPPIKKSCPFHKFRKLSFWYMSCKRHEFDATFSSMQKLTREPSGHQAI